MFTLKLYNTWENEANELIFRKHHKVRNIPIPQQKQLRKFIATLQPIKQEENYILYGKEL